MSRYALDTNLYVRAFRNAAAADEITRFYAVHLPRCYLCSVVHHELLIGASTPAKTRQLEDDVVQTFRRTGRMFAPSARAWQTAAEVMAGLAVREKLELRTLSRSFGNDVLLAVACLEAGITLVTENVKDFSRIARIAPFSFVSPWPT